MKLTPKEFDLIVQRAIERIPAKIREPLANVSITVQKRPSQKLLAELGMTPDDPPLGLYEGTPLLARSVLNPPRYPDTIYIFQEPLENMCSTRDDLEREIAVTIVHEVAHFLGIDEDRLEDLGYG